MHTDDECVFAQQLEWHGQWFYVHPCWSNIVVPKGARELLAGETYPDEDLRRATYVAWLRIFATGRWQDSFGHLMFNCVAATPSPSNPERPIFADLYRAEDPVDRRSPIGSVINIGKLPLRFCGTEDDVSTLPTSSPFLTFMADLIRKSRTCRAALDEAGIIISFCSLTLAVVAVKQPKNVQDFFRSQTQGALPAVVPTTFNGDIPWPRGRFITELARKLPSPFFALLVIGQHSYHVKAGERAPSADRRFLEEAFLTPTKFGRLEVLELFCEVQEQCGLSAEQLTQIIAEGSPHLEECSGLIRKFLQYAQLPTERALAWSRTTSGCFFSKLALNENIDYAMRLMAFLAPDAGDRLWQKPELKSVSECRVKKARVWAKEFKHALRKGKYGDLPNWKP